MGGLYLTTYNQDLENCFILGEEIDCYRNETDLLSKLQYYISHPDIALNIGAAGRNRCLREHTWIHKFKTILSIIGLSNQTSDRNSSCLLNSHFKKAISMDTNYTEAIQNLENAHLEQAFSKVEQYGGKLDGWALSKNEIRSFAMHILKTNPEPNIIELGEGSPPYFGSFLHKQKHSYKSFHF